MVDFIIRDCGRGEFLPLIVETNSGRELYRGSRVRSAEGALRKAQSVWENEETGNIQEFKAAQR